jgi:transcriptional regulator
MYHLPYFKEKDPEQVIAFMHQHPFVMLVGADADGKPVATQVPLLITEKEGQLVFRGHIMRQTDHHKAFEQNPHVLAIFTGPHSYVSASWYTNPQQGGTWNYISVQAKGTLTFLEEAELRGILKNTTSHFENDPHSPALYEKLPEEYIQKLIKAIVGIEITVTAIDNVFKLSQNRDEASYHQIIDKLHQGDGDAQKIADIMKDRTSQLFKGE